MSPRKVVPKAPPVVVVRKKVAKPAPRALPAATPSSTPAKGTAPTSAYSEQPPPEVPQLETLSPPQPGPPPQVPAPESPPVSPGAAAAVPSKSQQEKLARRALLDVFLERWPQAFPRDFRQITPWALGIHAELAAQLPAQPLGRIKAVLGLFQRLSGAGYLLAVLRGGPRYALDGSPRGAVTPEEHALAQRELAAFYARRQAQRQRAPAVRAQPAPPPAPAEP
jgi:hypothetical protein